MQVFKAKALYKVCISTTRANRYKVGRVSLSYSMFYFFVEYSHISISRATMTHTRMIHVLLLVAPVLTLRPSPGCGAEIPHQPHPGCRTDQTTQKVVLP